MPKKQSNNKVRPLVGDNDADTEKSPEDESENKEKAPKKAKAGKVSLMKSKGAKEEQPLQSGTKPGQAIQKRGRRHTHEEEEKKGGRRHTHEDEIENINQDQEINNIEEPDDVIHEKPPEGDIDEIFEDKIIADEEPKVLPPIPLPDDNNYGLFFSHENAEDTINPLPEEQAALKKVHSFDVRSALNDELIEIESATEEIRTNNCPVCEKGKFVRKDSFRGWLACVLCLPLGGPFWCRRCCSNYVCNKCGAYKY